MSSRAWIGLGVVLLFLTACSGLPGRSAAAEASAVTPPVPTTSAIAAPQASPTISSTLASGFVPGTEPAFEPTATVALPPVETVTPVAEPTPSFCPFLLGQTEAGAFHSSAMGEEVRFLVHFPPCYDRYPDRAFPVLYLFHGWPLNEWHWDGLGIDEWSDDWISRGLIGPFLLVLPGVNQDGLYVNSSGGSGSFEGFVTEELVPYIDSTYRTVRDPSARAVGGISRGGVWSLEIAMRHPDVFSSVGGHSPALALNRPLPQYDPFLLARESTSGLRFYLDAGDADWANAGTIRLRDLLLELGADVTYEMHVGGHVDELWGSGIPDYLTFYTATWPDSYAALLPWSPATQGAIAPEAP